jgi:hypothetical protein
MGKNYRYKVSNGVRLVRTKLRHHLPSRIVISGHTVDNSYEGQPQTYFGCQETGHIYQNCPHRRRGSPQEGKANTSTWANIAAQHTPTDKDIQSIEHTNIPQIGQRTAERNSQQQNMEVIQTNSEQNT